MSDIITDYTFTLTSIKLVDNTCARDNYRDLAFFVRFKCPDHPAGAAYDRSGII